MDIQEPEIRREDVLVLDDADFNPGQVMIVTGASSGIGRAAAIAGAVNNLTVVGLDVDDEGGRQTIEMAEALGGRMTYIHTDLTKDSDMEKAVAEAAKLGTIKYLINIAGVQHIDFVEDFPLEKFDYMQSLMLRAPFVLSKLTIPHMKNSPDGRGVIGQMASVHGHICTLAKSSYNISKFGLRALAQSISAEGDGKVRSFTVSTGFVKTALALKQIPAQAAKRGITPEKVVTDVMMGDSRVKEMMSPIEVANLFTFGVSRFAKYLVGGDMLFDGGMVLTYAEKKPAS